MLTGQQNQPAFWIFQDVYKTDISQGQFTQKTAWQYTVRWDRWAHWNQNLTVCWEVALDKEKGMSLEISYSNAYEQRRKSVGEACQHWAAVRGSWLAPRSSTRYLAVLLRAMDYISDTYSGNLSCFSLLSGHGFIAFFFPLSFSTLTTAINECVMPAGLLHYLGSRQSSLDTSSYQTASCGILWAVN